jgi:hypothetical protein
MQKTIPRYWEIIAKHTKADGMTATMMKQMSRLTTTALMDKIATNIINYA